MVDLPQPDYPTKALLLASNFRDKLFRIILVLSFG
jgi:hypothetical protein